MVRGPAMAPAAGPGAVAAAAAAAAEAAEEMRWRQLDSGVSAVSFGFVATAILVSMFLAMAILEHFLRPPAHAAAPPPRGILRRLLGRGGGGGAAPGADLEAARKLEVHAPLEVRHTVPARLAPALAPIHGATLFMIRSPCLFLSFPLSRGLAFRYCVSGHLMDLIANLVGPPVLAILWSSALLDHNAAVARRHLAQKMEMLKCK